ncbi:HpcH/HpaI aldolase/citrate lyase family protein [Nocardia sp. NPDC088792]|uniref:HpcH/HpaI aldolase/citrate lyase family protein n=1 Tax=Nocardia sp. NPDC088792 TaxID=3364332 RepID=UPI00380E7CCF
MRHFRHVPGPEIRRLFHRQPEPFGDTRDRELLAMALGATLYVPATRPGLTETIVRRAHNGVCSMVIDLEDAVADHELAQAKRRAADTLAELGAGHEPYPLLFVRVRDPGTVREIVNRLGADTKALTGFVFPKFDSSCAADYLDALDTACGSLGRTVYGMPVLESPALVHRQTRDHELHTIARLLTAHRDRVLAVRIGATDMCSTFGIRRDSERTIYDVRVVADVIADIVNYLGRSDGSGFTITGPVWEYFDVDGLLREAALDRANGIQGKTVIHPAQVAVVHALSVVTLEEYSDALDILGTDTGGVAASEYRNKMNEMRPHRSWARRTLLRARLFGVADRGVSLTDLMKVLVEP